MCFINVHVARNYGLESGMLSTILQIPLTIGMFRDSLGTDLLWVRRNDLSANIVFVLVEWSICNSTHLIFDGVYRSSFGI